MPGRVLSKKNESALRSAVKSIMNILGLLEDDPEPDMDETTAAEETEVSEANPERTPTDIEVEFVPLMEKAVRRDGTIPLKVIEPGWGTSGYYPAAVLERDGPRVFRKGTKQFWNHQTATEEAERPEGDLSNLAAELVSDARWDANGPKGPGLYADAKVFGPYREAIDELAPHIGVSIRASGQATAGEVEGRKGPIIQAITDARSIDFVTTPGAGGRILELFEAARATRPQPPKPMALTRPDELMEDDGMSEQLQEAMAKLTEQNARLQESLLLRDARDVVRERVAAADVPDVTKRRLAESLAKNPPTTDDGTLDREALTTRVDEAIKAEVEYLTQAAGFGAGRVEGMGGGNDNAAPEFDSAKMLERSVAAYQRMGMTEAEAKAAAQGRGV